MASQQVVLEGHIVDSLILAKVLDLIIDRGGDYQIDQFDLGRTQTDPSHALLTVTAANLEALRAIVDELQMHGANPIESEPAVIEPAPADGVLPAGFYSTTNLPTDVRVAGVWRSVDRPEMDCALVVDQDRAHARPMHRVKKGDAVVVGSSGVRVHTQQRAGDSSAFEFMASEVSSEKPKAALISDVAKRMRAARSAGKRILVVTGPAVVHTGAAPDLARLVREGWIDVIFSGNGFATHDIEANVLGTALGVTVAEGFPTEGGHANHLRVINEVRRHGSIAAAVDAGYITGGVMFECVKAKTPFVLAGSVRDDGPLPDVITDSVAAADAMREQLDGLGVALMLASTLHAIATGNVLPADVQLVCVDISQAVATKLADRGSRQAVGIVTDVGLFVRGLTQRLIGDDG